MGWDEYRMWCGGEGATIHLSFELLQPLATAYTPRGFSATTVLINLVVKGRSLLYCSRFPSPMLSIVLFPTALQRE